MLETKHNLEEFDLVKIDFFNHTVTGVFIKLQFNESLIKKISPHEKVNLKKVADLQLSFFSGEPQNKPIIIGLTDNALDVFLTEYINLANVIHEDYIEEQKETVLRLPQHCHPQINNIIQTVSNMIIIDGHHRFSAFKELFKNSIKTVYMNAWFVPFKQLSIYSFIKKYKRNDTREELSSYIENKYHRQACNILPAQLQTYEIRLFIGNLDYQYLANSETDFITELKYINQIIENSNCQLMLSQPLSEDINKFREDDEHSAEIFCLIHSKITHTMVLNMVAKKECFPIHSTCFKPKPCLKNLKIKESVHFDRKIDFHTINQTYIIPNIIVNDLQGT